LVSAACAAGGGNHPGKATTQPTTRPLDALPHEAPPRTPGY
jgi:hypothetical protein